MFQCASDLRTAIALSDHDRDLPALEVGEMAGRHIPEQVKHHLPMTTEPASADLIPHPSGSGDLLAGASDGPASRTTAPPRDDVATVSVTRVPLGYASAVVSQ